MFCLANLPIQTILNHLSKREYARCFLPLPHTPEAEASKRRKREARFTQIDSSFTSLWTETYTQSYVKIPIILLNTVGYVLCEPKQLRKKLDVCQY